MINPATYILMVIIGASPTMRPKLKTTMEAAMTERPRAYDRYEQHPLESKGIEAARTQLYLAVITGDIRDKTTRGSVLGPE